ncbi:MAG: portal protein [Alphaproteobacteria bacterium]|nr:portal protein [Alphaproteobacteria bacterium]
MTAKILQLYKHALDAREPWARRWTQCQRFTQPSADDESATLFDATAGDAVENLAASMYSLLTPPESLWMNLVREPSPDGDADPLIDATAHATLMLRTHLNDSNFYTTIHQCYLDLVILGTACLFMSENPVGAASAFSFTAIPMNDIAITRGAIFHTTAMPASEVAQKYPEWTPPANLRQTIKENPDAPLRLVQALVGTDFITWLDVGGDFENNIVSRGTFETNPYIIFRWSVASGESYGRSPVLRALPDIKTANKVVELVLKNATIAVSGIWQADDDGVINLSNINLTPGAIIPKAVGSTGLTPLRSGADFDVSQIILGDLRARILHTLLADRLQLMSNREMTATEILARNADMMRVLGATYGRLLHEFIRPLVDRGLQILSRRGVIDKISLHGDAQLKYIAPIAQMTGEAAGGL